MIQSHGKLVNVILSVTVAVLSAAFLLFSLCVSSPRDVSAAEPAYSLTNMLAPVWEGTTSYNESVLVVEEENGTVAPIKLLYPIEKIREVRNARLDKVYRQGTDYSLEDGKLVINTSGSIPRITYSQFHPATGTSGFEHREGGYVLWNEGSWFHDRQIVVTYSHAESYDGYIPEGKGKLLPKTLEKLKAGGTVELLVYGDSISTGGNSSGHPDINVLPNMPIYPAMFAAGMESKYGVTVNMHNESVGGWDSGAGLTNLRPVLTKYESIDLIILAFGMNDITVEPAAYLSNIKSMMRALGNRFRNAEFLLVAPMLPNYDAVKYYGNQPLFYDLLKGEEKEGVAAVDVTGMHGSLLETKRFADMTGNNVNHANDYMARIYAQTLLRTVEESEYGLPEEPQPDDPAPEVPGDPNGEGPGDKPDDGSGNASDDGSSSAGKDERKKGGCKGSAQASSTAAAILIILASALVTISCKKQKTLK